MENTLSVVVSILRNLSIDFTNAINDLNSRKAALEQQITEVKRETFENKKPGFFSSFFKTKAYQEYLTSQSNWREEHSHKSSELDKEEKNINNEIENSKQKIRLINKLINNPDEINFKVLKEFFNDYNELEKYCDSKNINMSCSDKLILGKKGDIEFMSNAIAKDFRLIAYDNTYSLDLYKMVIDSLNDLASKSYGESNATLFEQLKSGQYDDHFVKHVLDYIKHICSRSTTEEETKKIIYNYYLGLESKLPELYAKYNKENFGKALEALYEKEDIIVGCHATNYKPQGDNVQDDQIFEKGIREPNRGQGNAMQFTVAYNIPFLEVLDYNQMRYGDVNGGIVYIVAIPKSSKEPIWGKSEDGKFYIIPEYIVGKYDQYGDAELIMNTNQKKVEYTEKAPDKNR